MNVGFIIFFLAGAYSVYTVAKYNIDYSRAVKQLEDTFRSEGREWRYERDVASRLKVFTTPESITDASDSPAVAIAKQNIVKVRKTMPSIIKRGILVLVIGTVAAAIAGVVGLEVAKP